VYPNICVYPRLSVVNEPFLNRADRQEGVTRTQVEGIIGLTIKTSILKPGETSRLPTT
jgi:hypothetical protein